MIAIGKPRKKKTRPMTVLAQVNGERVQAAAYWANTVLGTSAVTFDEISSDGESMTALARERYRTDPLYRAIIKVMLDAVLGSDGGNFEISTADGGLIQWAAETGIDVGELRDKVYAALTNTRGLQEGVKQLRHSRDISGRMNVMELNRLVLRELFNTGEALLIKTSRGLQFVPRERVIDVERDKYGAIKAFWVSKKKYKHNPKIRLVYGLFIQGLERKNKVKIPASSAIWLCHRDEPDQLRGNGILWCSLHVFQDIAAIIESSTACWDAANRYVMAIENATDPQSVARSIGAAEPITEAEKVRQLAAVEEAEDAGETPPAYREVIEDEAGQTLVLHSGMTAKHLGKNDIPNDKLAEHLMALIRIALCPLHIDAASGVMADFTDVNYSAARAANDMKRNAAEVWQPLVLSNLLLPQQRWHLRGEMAAGRLPVPLQTQTMFGAMECGQWILQTPTVNAKEATETDQLDIELGLKSKGYTRRSRNIDPQVLAGEIVEDVALDQRILDELKARGIDIGTMTAINMSPYFRTAIGKTEAAVIAGKDNGNQSES